jgi:PIN domain nuclease of toxin-antitoxin system
MLNLDTHIFVYALSGELTRREADLLAAQPWSIAAIVLWEITTLSRLGRISIDIDSTEFSHALSAIHVWPLDLAVCRAERVAVNRTGGYQGGGHVPIAEYHTERGIPLTTRHRREVGETIRIELGQEPSPRFSQQRLAAEVEQLEIQLRAFERCRHFLPSKQECDQNDRSPIHDSHQPLFF